jgi:hypothetical protein
MTRFLHSAPVTRGPQRLSELNFVVKHLGLKCDFVLDLLAYQEGKQGEDSISPGGYINYVI